MFNNDRYKLRGATVLRFGWATSTFES